MDIKLMPEKYKKTEEFGYSGKGEKAGLGQITKMVSQSNFWFIFSIILLILVVVACLGLWGYKNNLTKKKDGLASKIEGLENQRDKKLEINLIDLRKGIENFKNILKNHIYPSNIFKMLEELALPQVQFTGLEADLAQAKISLEVKATNYITLAKQLVVFRKDSRIKKADLSEVKMEEEGGVGSTIDLELNSESLRQELKQ